MGSNILQSCAILKTGWSHISLVLLYKVLQGLWHLEKFLNILGICFKFIKPRTLGTPTFSSATVKLYEIQPWLFLLSHWGHWPTKEVYGLLKCILKIADQWLQQPKLPATINDGQTIFDVSHSWTLAVTYVYLCQLSTWGMPLKPRLGSFFSSCIKNLFENPRGIFALVIRVYWLIFLDDDSPLNHMINIIRFVIWCSRNLLTRIARGKMLQARPMRQRMRLHTTRAGSTRCLKLKIAKPRYAKTHVSAMKASVLIVCCMVICVTVDRLKWV